MNIAHRIVLSRSAARLLIAFGFVLCASVATAKEPEDRAAYKSPYSVEFDYKLPELLGDLQNTPRGNPRDSSSLPYGQWYTENTLRHWGAWGPPARHYPPVQGIERRPLAWRQQRVIAIALAYQGYEYQHHHIPDFEPPANWPWKEVGIGHNGKGVDCSNFTSFVYNLGFGLKPNSAIQTQAEEHRVPGPGEGHYTRALLVERPSSYEEFSTKLHTGDLLFIRRQNKREISHVIIWVGSVGRSPDDQPLIIDSHGDGVHDSNGKTIPAGIYLRPFSEKSWYFREADHALRLLHDES